MKDKSCHDEGRQNIPVIFMEPTEGGAIGEKALEASVK